LIRRAASSVLPSIAEAAIRADAKEVRQASEWVGRACSERGVPLDEIGRLDVCLNETLANILAHGGEAAQAAPVLLRLEVRHGTDSGEAVLSVSDTGDAFDPLTFSVHGRPRTLAEADPGGLGLLMIRSSADSLDYHRLDGRNHLSFGVCWSGSDNG
jgi:anti-sigma regulatory factor (Ser/Thr protein kinase)